MMHYGSVNDDGEECSVRLTIQGSDQHTESISFIIDTGATGSMVLPLEIVDRLNLSQSIDEYVRVTQADGSSDRYGLYVAHVMWHGSLKQVEVVAFGPAPLIGMGLLQGSNLSVDAIPGGLVTITELRNLT
ncbi:MAG: aspartyl protease family protein [Chloroflexi bacterium]|nr:aspartyl protease family protein [Chloroflexota bacterium]